MLCKLKLFYLVLFTLCINLSYCQRRIVHFNYTTVDHRYMVYLIQSKESYPKLDSWLCGGALVKTNKILTSAACLIQCTNIYAIAGYKKYISTDELDSDNCTGAVKRRVIRICVPHGYNYDQTNSTTWMTLDVGVAVVDRPYRSADDVKFRIICHYAPKPIPILYHKDLTYVGLDVLALGWGFLRGRRPGDPGDYNSESLKYASTIIRNITICQEKYPGMAEIIEKYMFCTNQYGNIDDDGTVLLGENKNTECSRRYGANSGICRSNETKANLAQIDARKQIIYEHGSNSWGICQNDHGGPLVAFIGGRLKIVGIAVNTIYDNSYQCVGPSLFTSTACTNNFIMCMLSNNPLTRRAYEQVIKEDGFEIIQRDIEWADEPADHSTPAASVDSEQEVTTARLNASTRGTGNKSTFKPSRTSSETF